MIEPGSTEKAVVPVATSAPVVTVTVRGPVAALSAIVICALRAVTLVTVTLLTAISGPQLTWVVPCAKCVDWPVIVIETACPCLPEAGEKVTDRPGGRTVNAFGADTTS